MKPVYIMVGDFFGAGKTSTISRLARHDMSQGKKVGIVTNDQTTDLVDTHNLRSQGFDVGEYAEGEAEPGWLNSQVVVQSTSEFELDTFLMNLIARLHGRLLTSSAEAAHLKVIGLCEGSYAVANLVSNATGPELSLASNSRTPSANVVVNARVATDPAELEKIVREELAATSAELGLTHNVVSLQSFRPGRPVPTHRIVE